MPRGITDGDSVRYGTLLRLNKINDLHGRLEPGLQTDFGPFLTTQWIHMVRGHSKSGLMGTTQCSRILGCNIGRVNQ